jgi:hypothetical protein
MILQKIKNFAQNNVLMFLIQKDQMKKEKINMGYQNKK